MERNHQVVLRCHDYYFPTSQGTVLTQGPEQSEVRWDNDIMQAEVNEHLCIGECRGHNGQYLPFGEAGKYRAQRKVAAYKPKKSYYKGLKPPKRQRRLARERKAIWNEQ